MWDLGNMKKVCVRDFKGKTYIDIRSEYFFLFFFVYLRFSISLPVQGVLRGQEHHGHEAWEEGHLPEHPAVPGPQGHHGRHRPRPALTLKWPNLDLSICPPSVAFNFFVVHLVM